MFPILWEILTASQKLSDRNVLWRDLKSSQSSKANVILATSETTRGVWEKKIVFLVFGSCFQHRNVVEHPPSLWEATRDENPFWHPDVGGGKLSLYSQEVALILLIPPQPPQPDNYQDCPTQTPQVCQHQQDHFWSGVTICALPMMSDSTSVRQFPDVNRVSRSQEQSGLSRQWSFPSQISIV